MSTHSPALGHCPECAAAIPRYRLLISYERQDGQAHYADCPDCGAVVHPEQPDDAASQ